MNKQEYEHIKKVTQQAVEECGACSDGLKAVAEAENIGRLCAVLKHFWPDVIGKLRDSIVAILKEVYPHHREEFKEYGIFFNEGCDHGRAIVTEGVHEFGGDARVWAFGESKVYLTDTAQCVARDKATVAGTDYTKIMLYGESYGAGYGRCFITANENSKADVFDKCTVGAGENSTIHAHGWKSIVAAGNAVIYAPKSYKIKLLGDARLELVKEIAP